MTSGPERPGVSAAMINFMTPDLLDRAIESFRRHYPDVRLIIVDNGSGDSSADVIHRWQQRYPAGTEAIFNARNIHHGPAMDQAIRHAGTPLVCIIDSDCEVLAGGWLEQMMTLLAASPSNYAAGKQIFVNDRGFDVPDDAGGHPYIRPICLLLRRPLYLTLPPFRKHGSPCLENMTTAVAKGYRLIDFPVEKYIRHEGRGTAGRHGYRLGLRGKLNHLLNRIGL